MDTTFPLIKESPQGQAARDAINEAAKPPMVMKHYGIVAKQLAMVFRRHGLGQTLAYMELRSSGRPNSPYDLLGRQLDRWLLGTLQVSAPSALAALSTRDSRFYLEASEQAWLFLRALSESLEKTA